MSTVEFPTADGGTVLVQVEGLSPVDHGVVTRGGFATEQLQRAEHTFESALSTVRVVAEGLLAQLAGLAHAPEEVHVEFGLELTAKAGTLVVIGGGTAHLKVALTWRPDKGNG